MGGVLRWRRIATAPVCAIACAVGATSPAAAAPTAFVTDLAGLRSGEGLYTGPQIRQEPVARADEGRVVYPTIPKAVWLVAHLRAQAGIVALPARDAEPLRRYVAGPDAPPAGSEERALLLAAARLARFDVGAASPGRVIAPARVVASTRQAMAWAERAQRAADLGAAPRAVRITPWRLRDDVDVAAFGLVLATARNLGARVDAPRATLTGFAAAATRTRFRATRWRLWAASGLVAVGRLGAAERAVRGKVRVGCPGFEHLVRDFDGTCDLEATWFALRLADADLPAGRALAQRILGRTSVTLGYGA